MNGMHAVEDYIVSRYQMYVQVYFHSVSRGMEVILEHLLDRAHELSQNTPEIFAYHSQLLLPFLNQSFTLEDYLKLDDGVLNTYFAQWSDEKDVILSDLAQRFLNRKPLKSVAIDTPDNPLLSKMRELVEKVGFNARYYTAINSSYDLPYDFYRPELDHHRTQIEIMQSDGTLVELSQASHLVAALAGQGQGDARFYYPKEMTQVSPNNANLFDDDYTEFASYIHNGKLLNMKKR